MHILYLPSWYPLNADDINGCFFREQAHALAKTGHKVGVIAPQFRSLRLGKQAVFNRYDTEVWQDDAVITYLGHGVFWFPKVPYLDLSRWVANGISLFKKYVKEQGMPDVLHVQSVLYAGPLALKIYQKYHIPYCVMEHSTTFARGLVNDWQLSYIKYVTDNSQYNMAVSHDLANLLASKFTGSTWHYFPNLLDTSFELEPNSKAVDSLQFCAVAGLQSKKGFDVLLNAFAEVLKKYSDYRLVIGGDGPEKDNLHQLAVRLKISHAVTFLGRLNREQVKTLMASSFCYVLSSHIETFGVVVIESLSQGTPVISTKCGGPESILTHDDGLLIEKGNVTDLANAMIQIIESSSSYDRDLIRANCLNRFSEKTFTKGILDIYQQCIALSASESR